MAVVLGCSPGTRTFGIALLRDRVLIDYEVRTFRGKWGDGKLRDILARIDVIIDMYKITRIAVKVPDVFPTSMGYNQLIGRLNVLFETKGMNVHYYTLRELRKHCSPTKDISKAELAEHMVSKYSALHAWHTPFEGQLNNHHFKAFEAVCAAQLLEKSWLETKPAKEKKY